MSAGPADWRPPVRAEFADSQPYGAPQLDVPVALNVNENPYPPPPAVVADIARSVGAAAERLNRYPDREASALRAALAGYLNGRAADGINLTADDVWVANGSNEVMTQLLQAFGGPGRTMMTFPPTYSMYPEYARATHTRLIEVPRGPAPEFALDPDFAAAAVAAAAPDVVMLASPNNPTGTAAPRALIEAVLSATEGMVVVDEAYAEFARDGGAGALDLLADHPNLVITRTMSKAFALAGARVGYAAAHPRVIDALRVVRLPYHVSAVTQATAQTALRHADALLADVDVLRSERDAMVAWLRERQLLVADSDANFVLMGVFDDRRVVWQGLLDRGVLIRQTGPAGWLRVSIGTPGENRTFRTALEEVLG